jgi:uncharacterized protein YdaU (DUF1376 family)
VRKLPFMKLWVADYLSDTLHLNMEQSGAYLQLLMIMWKEGGALRANPDYLAKVCRMTPERWGRIAPDILPYFTVIELDEGDVLQHRRLSEELAKVRIFSESRSANARAKPLSAKGANGPLAEHKQSTSPHTQSQSHRRGRGYQEREGES